MEKMEGENEIKSLVKGVLSQSSDSTMSLLSFIFIACLPIKIKDKEHTSHQTSKRGLRSPLNYAIKVLLLALVIKIYDYRQYIHQNLILALYCCHIYFAVDIVLAMSAAPARVILGFEIEPQFDDPYLSTSLQDFWGRRWNLMVTSILRPTVYDPIRSICTLIVGKKWALLIGMVSTFIVSGLMHELIYYYATRVAPTWEVTWFFFLHGVCTALEIVVKKALADRWRLHPVISTPLTIGFVGITGFWLFFPQIVRNEVDLRAIEEYSLIVKIMKRIVQL
ncbi:hypothetical protein IFM89_023861 [Coptis chinensis]|uniref:Wax synthase domain-containing protein n=1 Tax=Coptis chinensis TaxID=261450 RepID=A0A835IFJ9_9MAGN|nr:hypothetical protein IFM89_023861 [Coptis chinensis]